MNSGRKRTALSRMDMANYVANDLLERDQKLRCSTYPRRYQVPNGYVSPKKVAGRMASHLAFSSRMEASGDATSIMSLEVVKRLVEYKVPTYWVGRELLEALTRTNLPNIHGSELNWPMPAMLFMLPKDVFFNPKGASVYFIGVALCPNRSLVCWTQVDEPNGPPNYAISEFVHQRVLSEIRNARIRDDIEIIAYEKEDSEAEKSFTTTLLTLGINLMLIMNVRPQLVEMGEIVQPLGFGGKRATDPEAPWTPNWIGKHYRLKREQTLKSTENNQSDAESGITLRTHWRKGHLREQRWGEGLQQVKLIWIEPVLVNADRFH